MKNVLLIMLGIIPSFGYCQAVSTLRPTGIFNIKCQYKLTYKSDSTSSVEKTDFFILFLGKNTSYFEEEIALKYDSLLNANEGLEFNQSNAHAFSEKLKKLAFPVFTYSIYKYPLLNQVIFNDKIGKVHYQYAESKNIFTWHITQEKAKINGLTCQKALTSFAGRIWAAWFTREISISDGPYKFYGLPDLILKISDNKDYYQFEITSIKQLSIPLPIPVAIKATSSTTKQDFVKGKATYALGATDRVAAMGNIITDAQKQAYQERLRKQNNPLELR